MSLPNREFPLETVSGGADVVFKLEELGCDDPFWDLLGGGALSAAWIFL